MSWQIPTQVEQDIIGGKATYRTFQTGNGGQSILPVPPNAYVVIFGYDFSPAGGGFFRQAPSSGTDTSTVITDGTVRPFETQQIAFYTGTDFYPFIHHVNIVNTVVPATQSPEGVLSTVLRVSEVDNTPLSRQVYITSGQDITVTHGLVLNSTRASANAIPVTNRTPQGLTYGGSGQTINTQTNYGPAVAPQQFMQPSPKDYQDFAFGLLPANADGQAFATPDATNGLIDSTLFCATYIVPSLNNAASQYYLCLHYALYQSPISSKQG